MKENDTIGSLTVHPQQRKRHWILYSCLGWLFSRRTRCKGDTVQIGQDDQSCAHKTNIPTVGLMRQCKKGDAYLL